MDTKFTKASNNFCQILNKPSENRQRHFSLCQSGEISPNLVTLVTTHLTEQLLQIPLDTTSNPEISNIYSTNTDVLKTIEEAKVKK